MKKWYYKLVDDIYDVKDYLNKLEEKGVNSLEVKVVYHSSNWTFDILYFSEKEID